MGKAELTGKPHTHARQETRSPRTLGPVENLEQHCSPDWWREIFDRLYLVTDHDIVGDRTMTAMEIDRVLEELQLPPRARILDLCCGHGRHTVELARREYSVEGFDRSRYLLRKARETSKREGVKARFRAGDARHLPYPADTFDAVVLLGNSFGYFESHRDDFRVLTAILRVLRPHGKLLLDVSDGDFLREHFKERSWEWIDKKYLVCRERSLSFDGQRLINREVITHTEKGVIGDRFYAVRLYSENSLQPLIERAGFGDLHFSAGPECGEAHIDPGLMEKRILVTASASKEWSGTKIRAARGEKCVAVILGDPAKPDALKPSCIFDDDDLITIDRMKAALKDLPGYRFIFLDNHDALVDDLLKLRRRIDYVFNLCDEGYSNDPMKELHIPALLDMLGIPTTGAGVQALAWCYDKALVKGIAKEMGIPVPEGGYIRHRDDIARVSLQFPLIVKPNSGDSSFGINQHSIVHSPAELKRAVERLWDTVGQGALILVEEFLEGSDLSVGIIGNMPDRFQVLPVIEEDYSTLPDHLPRICGYEAKWLPESEYWSIRSNPAEIPDDTRDLIVSSSARLFSRLECRDYARFDWRLNAAGSPKLLEVNPNPGWCWDGHLAKMAHFTDISYAEMLEMILSASEERIGIADMLPVGEVCDGEPVATRACIGR